MEVKKTTVLIWDLPVRIFHWTLVLLLACLWYTSDQDHGLIELHIKLGYCALSLVLFRIIWGLVGTYHAKFSNFIPSYLSIKQYLLNNPQLNKAYIGHNPSGSLMVIVILLLLLFQAISGLFISDDIFSSGPYFQSVDKSLQKFFSLIHHNAFDLLLVCSFFHVGAVIFYQRCKKQQLISAMVHGKKEIDVTYQGQEQGISHSKLWLAAVILLVVVSFVYWLVVINAPVIEEYY